MCLLKVQITEKGCTQIQLFGSPVYLPNFTYQGGSHSDFDKERRFIPG